MTRPKFSRLGAAGSGAALLATAAAGLMGAAATGGMPEAWVPMAAAGSGVGAGMLGCLGLLRRRPEQLRVVPARPAVLHADTMDNIAALLRSMAEEMVRLKRDGADASRSMAEARQASGRIVEAAGATIARLDESAESSAIAARALSLLPGIADSHAQRIEWMAARAEQALSQVPEAMAGQNGEASGLPIALLHSLETLRDEIQASLPQGSAMDIILERLESMPESIAARLPAPDLAGLEAAIARLDQLPGEIGTALAQQPPLEFPALDSALERLEAARPDPMLALGVMEATERLDALGGQITQALTQGTSPEATQGRDAALAESLHASLAPGLAEVLGRRFTALSSAANPAMVALIERLEGAAGRLEAMPASIGAASEEGLAGIGEQLAQGAARIVDAGQALDGTAARLAQEIAGIPAVMQASRAELGGAIQATLAPLATDIAQATAGIPHAMQSGQAELGAAIEATLAPLAADIARATAGIPDAMQAGQAELGVALQATLAPLAVDITQATARIPHAMRASQVELGKTIQAALAPLAADIANATAGLPAMMEACEAELGAALKARLAPLAQDIASATAGFPAVLEDYQAQFDAALQARLASVGDDIAAGIPAALDAGLAPLVPLAQDVAHATAGIPGLLEDCRAEFNAALQARLATLGEDIAACIPAALNAGLAPLAHGITAATAQIGPTLEARLAPLAEEVAHAAASFPEVAEGLQAHLGALETLGPVLDGVTEKLIETADALATAGDSLPPIADAARRAVDAMALAALNRPAPIETMRTTPARPTRPAAQPGSSVAASILGRLAAQEEPAIAATLMRLDGIGTEVASLLRDTENLVGPGNAVLSRPVASRAPELLESLDETIRGLQSISTAIAVAADRRLEHARAS